MISCVLGVRKDIGYKNKKGVTVKSRSMNELFDDDSDACSSRKSVVKSNKINHNGE